MTWRKITIEELKRHVANGMSAVDIATKHGMVTESVRHLIREHIERKRGGAQVEKDTSQVSPDSVIALIEKHGSHGVALEDAYEPPNEPEPDHSPIGSEERINAYRQRILNGQELFCEHDTKECVKPSWSESKEYRSRESGKEPVSVKSDGRRVLAKAKY